MTEPKSIPAKNAENRLTFIKQLLNDPDLLCHFVELGIGSVEEGLQEAIDRQDERMAAHALRIAHTTSAMLIYQAADVYAYLSALTLDDLTDSSEEVSPEQHRSKAIYPQGTE